MDNNNFEPGERTADGLTENKVDNFVGSNKTQNRFFGTGLLWAGAAVAVLIVAVASSIIFGDQISEVPTIVTSDTSCAAEYDKLFSTNEFDFSICKDTGVRSDDFDSDISKESTNIILVMDSSGSMAGEVSDGIKIDVAKNATATFLEQLKSDDYVSLGVVVYGHKGGNTESMKTMSCEGVEELVSLGAVDVQAATKKINTLSPVGWTPIASSLTKAGEVLKQKTADNNIIVLVTDGEETCGGDPETKAKELREGNPSILTTVIGFDVAGEEEEKLRSIARAGGGEYYSVNNALELQEALAKNGKLVQSVEFEIGRVIEEIYDISHVTHNYNQCMMALRREESVMMIDINVKGRISEACRPYAEARYIERAIELENKFNNVYEDNLLKFNSLR